MATEWVVTAPAERGDGANGWWFTVDEPQRVVSGGASAAFLVRIAVGAGTPAGNLFLQGRAYSADTAPEEGSRLSGRIAFDVRATEKPKKRWWPYAVVAAVVLVVLGVVGFLVFGRDEGPIRTGTLSLPLNASADFDNGTVVPGQGGDVFFDPDPLGAFLRAIGPVRIESIGVVPRPTLQSCPRELGGTFADLEVPPGTVLCVSTSEGRIAVVTIVSDPFEPGPLVLSYEVFKR
ncbi:MAG TPA: hypothetical protein VFC00_04840 [Micromonosporaceae bacterium]|nr:hypothetical protein [Micromonosporaceae bacterium]